MKKKIDVKRMKVPKRAVSAFVENDNGIDVVREWNILSKEDYKIVARKWKGLPGDGSQGTPLK